VKFTKIFRILTLAAIVSLLLLAVPSSPALAARDITLDPDSGDIDTYFYVDGTGFSHSNPDEVTAPQYAVDIYFSIQEASTSDTIGTSSGDDVRTYQRIATGVWVDEYGEFSKKVKVPTRLSTGTNDEDVHGGIYYVYVTTNYRTDTAGSSDEIGAVAQFTVTAGGITLSPTHGVVGTDVKITGEYFSPSEYITVTCDDEGVDIKSGDKKTSSAGGFTSHILIIANTAGEHTIAVEDDSGHSAEATFTVEPKIAVGATEGKAGDTVEVTGTGFGGNVGADVMLNGSVVGSGETDEYGSLTASFEVPDVAEGSYDVTVDDDDGNEASVAFAIYIATEVSISPVTTQASPGHVGTDITISGVGFEREHTITITYATEPTVVKTVTSDADGAFTATFKAPKSEAGAHTITASDGTNSLTTTFYMESTPPPVPEPLLPETDVKTASPVQFDWGDVTDDSLPVTYTLQVAIDDNFTTASIVREEKGLTDSEYTLTEAEKLEPKGKETPYYWRVKAIDSASNESAWSTPKSFYTGGGISFALPSWRIHLFWGIGVVVAIFFGYWLGRRRAAASY
jgi:hypothetical protein